MGKYYKAPQPTGREYVDRTKEFVTTTIDRCLKLPDWWMDVYLKSLIEKAKSIEDDVVRANAVYINNKMDKDALKDAYVQRDRLLTESLSIFAAYDVEFDRLMQQIDFAQSEKIRMKNILYGLISKEKRADPDIKDIKIVVTTRKDEMIYTSPNGQEMMKLRLTKENKDHWLRAEMLAQDEIRKRISNDKKALAKL